jgi:transcriptional regulator with XRE-family HTH domain
MTGQGQVVSERHFVHLRHTQTEIKSPFASAALENGSVSRENQPMKVRLAEIREAASLRLEDVAARLDVAISTVQRYERQTMSIPSERLPAVARAYGCRINDIFDDEDEPPTAEVLSLWDHVPETKRSVVLDVMRAVAAGER